MATVVIYTGKNCSYCDRAKNLLTKKKIDFEEIDLFADPDLVDELIKKFNGKRTIPQIFIDDFHVGGCDDLIALEQSGKLDKMLT